MSTPRKKFRYRINWDNVRKDLKEIRWRDPIVMILCALLIFLTVGSTVNAFSGVNKNAVRIELDAAYGGDETGYEGLVKESEVTANIVNELESLLKKDKRFRVYRTTAAGQTATLAERAAKIKKDNPMIVLSIHAGGSPNVDRSGMHVYAETPADKNHTASLKLANNIAGTFKDDTWTAETGYLYYQPVEGSDQYELLFTGADDTKDYQLDTFGLMKQCDMPVVVTDQFYVTNEADVQRWANSDGYYDAAVKLYQALCDYNGFERKN